jgi:hypothetical protein
MNGLSSSSILLSHTVNVRNQAITITRFLLHGYIKSGWILLDIVFVWFFYALFFLQAGGNVAYFYGTAGLGLAVLSVLSTVIMTQRATHARMYFPLSHLTSRTPYLVGLLFATTILRVFSFIAILLLGMSYHVYPPHIGIFGATLVNMLPGTIGTLLYTIMVAVLTVLLFIPIATRLMQILFLAWLALVLYSNTSPAFLAQHIAFVRLPLAPIAVCYTLGASQLFTTYTVLMLLLALIYILILGWLCTFCFKLRDLVAR